MNKETKRPDEKIVQLCKEKGSDWVRIQLRARMGGAFNIFEAPTAEVWLENYEKDEKRRQNIKERMWATLFIVLGACIGLGVNLVQEKIQAKQEQQAVIQIVKSDTEKHLKRLEPLEELLKKIKGGERTDIAPKAEILDKSFSKSSFGFDFKTPEHKSLVLSSFLSKLHVLPKKCIPEVINFYENLEYCEEKRKKFISILRLKRNDVSLSGEAEEYLSTLTDTIEAGKILLQKLNN